MKETEWKEVRKRITFEKRTRASVWTTTIGKDQHVGEKVSSFFFTEFPESYEAKQMAEVFKEFGLVTEVYIPGKRDSRGRRYGIARFRKVTDDIIIAAKLDGIQIEGKKIFANIPRFQRGVENAKRNVGIKGQAAYILVVKLKIGMDMKGK